MKRQLIAFALILALLPCLAAAAAENDLVIDNASLLTADQEAALEEMARSIQTEYAIDPVILTVDNLEGKLAQDYADDYYDRNGYADDGILFLLAMAEREWYISTCGSCIEAFTDYGIQQLGESIVWYLSAGDYYSGFEAYLYALPDYIHSYENEMPVDGYADDSGDYYHGEREEVYYPDYGRKQSPNLLISLLIGLAAAAVVVGIMKASMNTKRQQRSAGDYLKPGSYHLRSHQDLFLYSNVSKVRRQQNTGGGGGSRGGGSSVHRSSGGRRHGGGGGRF